MTFSGLIKHLSTFFAPLRPAWICIAVARSAALPRRRSFAMVCWLLGAAPALWLGMLGAQPWKSPDASKSSSAFIGFHADDEEKKPAAKPLASGDEKPLVPQEATLSPVISRLLEDKFLSDEEKYRLMLFHGQFATLPDAMKDSPEYQLATGRYDHASLKDPKTPPLLRAQAAYERGDLQDVEKMLEAETSPRARLLRGRAMADRGLFKDAEKIYLTVSKDLGAQTESAAELTAMGEMLLELAALQGHSASEYRQAVNLLSMAQQKVDRLYWPSLLAQAAILLEKDNMADAVSALHETLSLNPSSDQAWYMLGLVAVSQFDFASADRAVAKLRMLNPRHVLADLLEIDSFLTQKDPASARKALTRGLAAYPSHRRLRASAAAVAALEYDSKALTAALEKFRELSGPHPLAAFTAGKFLSFARQYEDGAVLLKAAWELQPNWSDPPIELGLLYMQSGQEEEALKVLDKAVALDPFNVRGINYQKLLRELATYKTLETEHFIIKYKEGIDEALARDMPATLEKIHADVTEVYGHQPKRKTLIEIMPDKRAFGVRITGMPWIWTIGACTGPLIAITPPRLGFNHYGPFDWPRVLRHEYVHTVTLSQTNNRIPHWLTEACAVSQEQGPRDYDTCQLLAMALRENQLFDLEGINWGFIRPRRPFDRQLAYAQSHWMVQYITETHGHETILKMLALCRDGLSQEKLIPTVTGKSPEQFMKDFKAWAGAQVKTWGLSPQPTQKAITDQLKKAEDDLPKVLADLLGKHPNHPDLLEAAARRALAASDSKAAKTLLEKYASVRPVDPWADQQLAILDAEDGRYEEAAAHLEELDRLDQSEGSHAQNLIKIYRLLKQPDNARHAAERALARQPYDPASRETAATLSLQAGKGEQALHHLNVLTIVEPGRSQHYVRLAALYAKLGKPDEADAAAKKARELDADAPVDRFLKPVKK